MKPQGNDNALYSLETVICLAFYLVIQFCLGNRHAWHFWIFVHLKKKSNLPPKTCFQLHDHSIDWLSSSTSIYLKFSVISVQEMFELEKLHVSFIYVDHWSQRLVYFLLLFCFLCWKSAASRAAWYNRKSCRLVQAVLLHLVRPSYRRTSSKYLSLSLKSFEYWQLKKPVHFSS